MVGGKLDEARSVLIEEWGRRDDRGFGPLLPHIQKCGLEIVRPFHLQRLKPYREGPSRGFGGSMLGTPIVDGAPEDRHASHLRESFSHEFHPFAGQLVILGCKPGGVPSRSGEARDKGERYRVGDDRHHDRDRDRRLLGSQGGLAGRDDDVHLEADQLGREVWEPIASSLGKPVLDTDVTTFDITELAEALLKGFDKRIGRRAAEEHTDAGKPTRLLRART